MVLRPYHTSYLIFKTTWHGIKDYLYIIENGKTCSTDCTPENILEKIIIKNLDTDDQSSNFLFLINVVKFTYLFLGQYSFNKT